MTNKKLTIILSVTALFLTVTLGTATASPILIGTTETLTLDANYPLKNSKAGNDREFNVNWLVDHYTEPPALPHDLTLLGKTNGSSWERTVWGSGQPYFDLNFDSGTKTSGSWELTNLSFTGPVFFSIKASNQFALYYADGLTFSTWDTSDINNKLHDMSHISFWTADAASQVPEPSTLLLFGLGCLGIASVGRKKS